MTSGGRRGPITDLLTTSRHPFRSFDTLWDSVAALLLLNECSLTGLYPVWVGNFSLGISRDLKIIYY